jgi:hypothetical protein
MKASNFVFFKYESSPRFEIPFPWIKSKKVCDKFTVRNWVNENEIYLLGATKANERDDSVLLALFPLDSNPDSEPFQAFPLYEEGYKYFMTLEGLQAASGAKESPPINYYRI